MALNTSVAKLIATERALMKFQVEVWRRSRDGDEKTKVTEAIFTFVTTDSGSHPRRLPPGLRPDDLSAAEGLMWVDAVEKLAGAASSVYY